MGNGQSLPPGSGPGGKRGNRLDKGEKKKRFDVAPGSTRFGRKRKRRGPAALQRLPAINPAVKCKLRLLRLERLKDCLLLEEEYITNAILNKPLVERVEEDRAKVEALRGTPLGVGTLEEIIDDNHAIVSSAMGPEYYVNVCSFVDHEQMEPGCSVLLHNKVLSVVGVLAEDTDPSVSVMKVEKGTTRDLCRRWWSRSTDSGDQRSSRTSPDASRALRGYRYPATQGGDSLWRTWNWEDAFGQGRSELHVSNVLASNWKRANSETLG
ncbi:26S proteasome regulatory subunit 4 [Cyanidiococcus yangmingshanensis]|uniref:26S proteasome regulatory subunit 4 n=1 Tax=Cyanidiococcus yangmingshanensis TaxID=2690220 RepID=A0A7J7IMT2_9RHOD|nr:26S proteasome regulatory subunit 4 [Cyanidiococcus yangmingshanensis]